MGSVAPRGFTIVRRTHSAKDDDEALLCPRHLRIGRAHRVRGRQRSLHLRQGRPAHQEARGRQRLPRDQSQGRGARARARRRRRADRERRRAAVHRRPGARQRAGAGARHVRALPARGVAELHRERDPQGLDAAVEREEPRRGEGRRAQVARRALRLRRQAARLGAVAAGRRVHGRRCLSLRDAQLGGAPEVRSRAVAHVAGVSRAHRRAARGAARCVRRDCCTERASRARIALRGKRGDECRALGGVRQRGEVSGIQQQVGMRRRHHRAIA